MFWVMRTKNGRKQVRSAAPRNDKPEKQKQKQRQRQEQEQEQEQEQIPSGNDYKKSRSKNNSRGPGAIHDGIIVMSGVAMMLGLG
jgi:hypothetical protein